MSAEDDPITRGLRHLALATSGLAAAIAWWPRIAASDRTPTAAVLQSSTSTEPVIARPRAEALAARPEPSAPAEPPAARLERSPAEPAEPSAARPEPSAPAEASAATAEPSPVRAAPARRPPPSASPPRLRAPPGAPDGGAAPAVGLPSPDPAGPVVGGMNPPAGASASLSASAALHRALAARGLSLSEVSAMADVHAELERFQRQPSPERLPELLTAIDAAEIPTALLRHKLDRLGEKLRRTAARLSPRDLELAERAYLDLETAAQASPARAERHALLAAAARLSARLD